MAELQQAVHDFGGHSVSLSGLSARSLENSSCPLILHVARDGQLRTYRHWVLFLGMDGGSARIVDSPGLCERVPVAEVLRRWDGAAIAVASQPVVALAITRADHGFNTLMILMTIGTVITVSQIVPDRFLFTRDTLPPETPLRRCRKVAADSLRLLLVAAGLGSLMHLVTDDGLLRNPDEVKSVADSYADTFWHKLSYDQVRQMVGNPEVVLIDARRQRDYQQGHIDGAISVPVNLSAERRRVVTETLSRSVPVIVYCQSTGCQFDEQIGIWLTQEGFTDVSVYPGGWNDWSRHERP
jgi:rhodanese-related sulfurtransferase